MISRDCIILATRARDITKPAKFINQLLKTKWQTAPGTATTTMGLVTTETGVQEKDTSVLRALGGGTKIGEDTGNFLLKKRDKDVVQEAHLRGENKLQ